MFELIRENNLYTDVSKTDGMVLSLVEFEFENRSDKDKDGEIGEAGESSEAIKMLVDNVHSIPVSHIVDISRLTNWLTVSSLD